jgi:hypothetical protein
MSDVSYNNNSCLIIEGFWAFLYFVGFCYLSNEWSKADDPPGGIGTGNVKAAIFFSFLSIFTWVIKSFISVSV